VRSLGVRAPLFEGVRAPLLLGVRAPLRGVAAPTEPAARAAASGDIVPRLLGPADAEPRPPLLEPGEENSEATRRARALLPTGPPPPGGRFSTGVGQASEGRGVCSPLRAGVSSEDEGVAVAEWRPLNDPRDPGAGDAPRDGSEERKASACSRRSRRFERAERRPKNSGPSERLKEPYWVDASISHRHATL